MKVKVRVNIHGIFSVSSASLVEVQKSDETEEPMETEQANDKDEQVHPNKCLFPVFVLAPHHETVCATTTTTLFVP